MEEEITITVDNHGDQEEQTLKAMKERMAKIWRPDRHAPMAERKIHRFPRGLRRIGGPDDRYTVPTVVAIGPYHHGQPHLQEMEKVKLTTLQCFCTESKCSVDDVYAKVLSVVGEARDCYADDDAVACMGDADFATMMLRDGCFLLQYISAGWTTLQDVPLSSSPYSILKDMMLLENQIPWLVLDVLMEFRRVDVGGLVSDVGDKFFPKKEDEGRWSRLQDAVPTKWWRSRRGRVPESQSKGGGVSYESYNPAHLLDLLRFSQIWRMPAKYVSYEAGNSSLISSSAVQLAQIGIKLTASREAWFGDMNVSKKPFLGVLSLSPVFLNDVTACWLVNMAALEATTSVYGDNFVSSYLSALAMLMDREEDVQQLRGQRVVLSTFSNTQTLDFFKRIGQHLHFGRRYFVILEQIEAYKRNRWIRTGVYKFVYTNKKTIAAVLSIASVLAGIFKSLHGK